MKPGYEYAYVIHALLSVSGVVLSGGRGCFLALSAACQAQGVPRDNTMHVWIPVGLRGGALSSQRRWADSFHQGVVFLHLAEAIRCMENLALLWARDVRKGGPPCRRLLFPYLYRSNKPPVGVQKTKHPQPKSRTNHAPQTTRQAVSLWTDQSQRRPQRRRLLSPFGGDNSVVSYLRA